MTQPLTGLWADRLRDGRRALLLSMCLLSLAAALLLFALSGRASLAMLTAVAVLLGMGNSLFHVWGGRMTATLSGNDQRALGIFVSSGVMGLTVGALYASWWLMAGMLAGVALLGSCLGAKSGMLNVKDYSYFASLRGNSVFSLFPFRYSLTGSLLVILAFVMLRSYVGESLTQGLEKSEVVLLLLAGTSMLGKALGGWVARRWGIGRSIVVLVGIAAACMMCICNSQCANHASQSLFSGSFFSLQSFLFTFTAVFAINLTMPMTLHLANRLLPGREGLAFGMLAAVLIPGYYLAQYLANLQFDNPAIEQFQLQANCEVVRSSGCQIMLLSNYMLAALLLTIAVELCILWLMGERRKRILWSAVAVNVLTNVPLNGFLLSCGNTPARFACGEVLVVIVEALWYYAFIRQWRRPASYSLLCNLTSLLVGILLQFLINSV